MSTDQRLRSLILILLLVVKENSAKPLQILPAENNKMTSELLKLLKQIQRERDFNTIAISQTSTEECPFNRLLKEITLPAVILNKGLAYTYKAQFSKELLILLCLQQSSVAARLAELSVFRGLKQTRIVAYAPHATDLDLVQKDCLDAMANDIYNVLIIQKDFSETQNYHTCNKFPLDAPRYKQKSLHLLDAPSAIFEHQFRNMYGTPILTFPTQLEPFTMLYYKADGKLELEGYLGRALKAFANRCNTTLFINGPYQLGQSVHFGVLQELAENGTVDVAAGMVFVKPNDELEKLSYPVQLLDFCYMVPLKSVPISELFIGIVPIPMLFCIFVFIVVFAALLTHLDKRKQISFINLFLNDQSIRGMLSQSFVIAAKPSVKTKFVVFLLCYMSIITNTTYQAYLQSFLTHPPLLPMHHSYEDLEAAGLTILFAEPDVPIIKGNKNLLEHFHQFKISKYEDWVKLRARMNTKYVYPITNFRWETIDLQQSLFSRPIFYFNSEFCFFRTMFCCLPIRTDLPYRDLLDDFVLRLHSSGIMKEWVSMSFLLMLKLKKVVFEDLSQPFDYGRPLVLDDFFWIKIQFVGSTSIAFLVFLGEILYSRWKKMKGVSIKRIAYSSVDNSNRVA